LGYNQLNIDKISIKIIPIAIPRKRIPVNLLPKEKKIIGKCGEIRKVYEGR
jgi:hypothetical protein